MQIFGGPVMMKKTLRIATGSFCHETNSFSSVLVTKEFLPNDPLKRKNSLTSMAA